LDPEDRRIEGALRKPEIPLDLVFDGTAVSLQMVKDVRGWEGGKAILTALNGRWHEHA
jgi:hypothetical protein